MIDVSFVERRAKQLGFSTRLLCEEFGVEFEAFAKALEEDNVLMLGMMLFCPGQLLLDRPEFILRCHVPTSGWIAVVRECFSTEFPPSYDELFECLRHNHRVVVLT